MSEGGETSAGAERRAAMGAGGAIGALELALGRGLCDTRWLGIMGGSPGRGAARQDEAPADAFRRWIRRVHGEGNDGALVAPPPCEWSAGR